MTAVDIQEHTRAVRRSRRVLILLVGVFLLPVVTAQVLYMSGWRPARTGNTGELVLPPRPISDVALTTLDGGQIRFNDLRHKWTLAYFGPADCPRRCADSLYKMRQVHTLQGKHQDRLQRVFIVTGSQGLERLQGTLVQDPGLKTVTGPRAGIKELARQFPLPAGSPADGLGRIYVVDPMGNLMMSYPADADPKGMHKDLARLLRVSQVG